ncbi:MAG: molybdopterin-dependent oxidoreductase [Gammaproteobacteria bacterium]
MWTATARHADIVYPATTALERNDFACGGSDTYFTPMHQVVEPYAEACDDYAVFSDLAERLGFAGVLHQADSYAVGRIFVAGYPSAQCGGRY